MILQISERNGFEAWRQLSQLYKPRTKSRSISLLSALMNLPPFTKDRTLLEQVLGLERLRDEYRRSSGAEVPDDLMLSVLVKCLPGHIRQHIQLQLTETSTYAETRRAVVGYESVTASWAVRLLSIEELADNDFDEYEVFDLTVYDTFEGSCKPIGVHDVRIAELRFGSVAFRERFVIANVTAPLISTGRNFSAQHVDTTLCPAEGLWLRTTLVKLIDGEWILDEFGESVSDLESLTTPIVAPRAIAEVITIAHAELLPPEDLGFDLSDDHFGVLKRAAPPRPADVPAAPGDAEVPARERDDSADPREVIVNGMRLDTNSPLRVLRDACQHLGLSTRGNKLTCLQRMWQHLQAQELISASAAERNLKDETQRSANAQPQPKVKGSPRWCKGIWLGKTLNNDVHIIGVGEKVFVKRSVRRLDPPFNSDVIAGFESYPWDYGYASLGAQLVLAKRIVPPTPFPAISVRDPGRPPPRDLDAEAVMNVPPTPDEAPPGNPAGYPAPKGAPVTPPLVVPDDVPRPEAPDVAMPAQAGQRPPMMPPPASAVMVPRMMPPPASAVMVPRASSGTRERDASALETEPPSKAPRVPPSKAPRLFQDRNVLEHEDEVVSFEFEHEEVELLEEYEFELQENVEVLSDAEKEVLSSSEVEAALDQLCVPYTPLEPELDEPSLLALDALADKVEMARLKGLGVLLPLSELDTSVTPKTLTTRFVRAWRDKKRNGAHVWLRRSRYVAREYAWLTPEREDLFSPASSSLTTRLLPILFLKLRLQGFVLAAIDVADAFLTVEQ
ncbi:unnamed protein product [Durusdinium trenchii]|uniref:SAP domain-containing protein n=1 Tax=Durusdinium trenchii TaxID=1381693 RepID=A0ABP0LAN3_9DINO